jgi:hypothetical protein
MKMAVIAVPRLNLKSIAATSSGSCGAYFTAERIASKLTFPALIPDRQLVNHGRVSELSAEPPE